MFKKKPLYSLHLADDPIRYKPTINPTPQKSIEYKTMIELIEDIEKYKQIGNADIEKVLWQILERMANKNANNIPDDQDAITRNKGQEVMNEEAYHKTEKWDKEHFIEEVKKFMLTYSFKHEVRI